MTDYLYAVIPYNKGTNIYTPDELKEGVEEPQIPELKLVDSEFSEKEMLTLFKDYLNINTCRRQSEFVDKKDGYSRLRAEIYRIARALGAHEVWYVAELATDEMYREGFSFDDWLLGFKNGERYASELSVDVLKGKYICTYYHDDFSDIILENVPQCSQPADEDDDDEDEDEQDEITQLISLQNDGRIKIDLKNACWEDIATVYASTLKEARGKIQNVLMEKNVKKPLKCQFKYECDGVMDTLMPQYLKALDLASLKHLQQKDKAGMPYFGHIARVSNACKSGPAKVVALLHDVVEDTDVTPEQLEEMGIAEFVIKAVLCLTHQIGESYMDFIKRAARNPIAREVKIADLGDNMDVRRLDEVTEEDFVRMEKYLNAWKYLKCYVIQVSEV